MDNPQAPTNPTNVAAAIKPTRRPRGKIARLPRKVREELNLMLSDGLDYAEVIRRLGEPAKHLNEDNIGRWYAGPYQRWLKDRAWLEEMSSKLDFAVNVLEDPDSPKIREASLAIVLKQMYELIADFDPVAFKEKLGDDPAGYSRLLNAIAKIAEVGLRYDRDHSEAGRTLARENDKAKKAAGLTDDLLRQYETEFKLLRRPRLAADSSSETAAVSADNGTQPRPTAPNRT